MLFSESGWFVVIVSEFSEVGFRFLSLQSLFVCLAESCWRIIPSSMCPMWLTSWAVSTSSPQHWCPVSLWTRPPTSPRSSGTRYAVNFTLLTVQFTPLLCQGVARSGSQTRLCATCKTPESCQHITGTVSAHHVSSVKLSTNLRVTVLFQEIHLFFLFLCLSVRFVSKSWFYAWGSFSSSGTCRPIPTGPTSSLIRKLTGSVCVNRFINTVLTPQYIT